MAITPIPNRYEGFIFNGENSRTYGVYITEPAVFDAPERDAELITIPGRNGQLIQDNGRWENIQVTYHCALPTNSEADFIQGVQDFRNMLASNIGYQRLEDEINTDEYRMGAFVSGLGVDTINKSAGTFDVVFNCKPQRFLTSGETAVSVASGGTLTNPTDYEARPTLQVWGYGELSINGNDLEIISAPIGWATVGVAKDAPALIYSIINAGILNNGDEISVSRVVFSMTVSYTGGGMVIDRTITKSASLDNYGTLYRKGSAFYSYTIENETFYKGTSKVISGNLTVSIETDQGTYNTVIAVSYSYDGNNLFEISLNATTVPANCELSAQHVDISEIRANSTQSALGSPLYFDLDIGEAYKIENDVPVSVNNAVTIPAKLPTLKPGVNTFTYDNTITQFEVVPGWWRL